MQVVIVEKNNHKRINRILDWIIYLVGYALVLIAVSVLFKKTIYIDNSYFGLWGLLAAFLIYLLNKTIKPLIVWLTLPLTALTLGLFYPFINVFILNVVDWIMGSHFEIHGLIMSFVVAIMISLMNILMEELVINPMIRKGE